MKKIALIVAGGSGSRMGADIPKQFLLLAGKPLLMHTISAFTQIKDIEIILVLPQDQIQYWTTLCTEYSFTQPHRVMVGGQSRFHSVKNGLTAVENDSLVAIHDGARPLVTVGLIEHSFSEAEKHGTAIAAIPLKDSIREQTLTGVTRHVNRNNFYLIQTPQTFRSSIIKDAYRKTEHENFTDDAGVAEEAGVPIRLIVGNTKNIKITTPEDLLVAELYLNQ